MTQHTDLKQGLGVSGGEGRQAGGGVGVFPFVIITNLTANRLT